MNNETEQNNLAKRNEMILNNMRLATMITNSFYLTRPSTLDSFNDLLSIAIIGLISAVDSFDESKNISFSSYAYKCITNSLLFNFRNCKRDATYVTRSLNDYVNSHYDTDLTTLEELVPSKVNIENSFFKNCELSRCMNLVLNRFKPLDKVIFLYHLSSIYQYEIASFLGFSQSYMARVIKKCETKLKTLYSSELSKESGTYNFQILNDDFLSFKVYLPNIENCINSERVSTALTNLVYYKVNNTADYVEFIFPKNDDAFYAIACIVHELELS